MQTSFHVELVTPEEVVFSGEAEMVQAPGAEGEFGVLPGHAPLVALLQPGLVRIRGRSHDTRAVFISGGVAEVNPTGCILLADGIIDISTISHAQAQASLDEASATLRSAESEPARQEAQKAMDKAIAILAYKTARG